METLFNIMLLSLFIPFLVGLSGSNLFMSGLMSFDKIALVIILYSLMTVMLLRKKSTFYINLSVLNYILPSLFFFFILLFHYIFTEKASPDEFLSAKKEIARFAFFIVLLCFSSLLRMKLKNFYSLICQFALFGIPLGLMTIYSAVIGSSTRRDMIVGEFVRAGGDLTSTNNLAAVLNITTLCAISALLIAKKPYHKVVWFIAALVSQGGRFLTFSNGSVVGLLVSVFFVLILSWKYDHKMYAKVQAFIILFIAGLSLIIIFSGKASVLFARLMETDDTGTLVSVSSRLSQYEGLWNLIINEPDALVLGVGTAKVRSALKTKVTLHNAYLLPLVSAGVVGFVAFLSLWWLAFRNFLNAVRASRGCKDGMAITIFIFSAFLGYSVQILTVPYSLSVSTLFFFLLSFSFMSYVKDKRVEFSEV